MTMNIDEQLLKELLQFEKSSEEMLKVLYLSNPLLIAAIGPILTQQLPSQVTTTTSSEEDNKNMSQSLLPTLWSVAASYSQQNAGVVSSEVSVYDSSSASSSDSSVTTDESVATATEQQSLMAQFMGDSNDDDEWESAMQRIRSHPREVAEVEDVDGMNALHAACMRYPPLHVMEALLQACASVVEDISSEQAQEDEQYCSSSPAMCQTLKGETPLHIASYSASEEVQELLLEAFPEAAKVADGFGDLPLHLAARSGATLPLLERFLLAYPQALGKQNKRGVTPFWLLPRSFLEADNFQELYDEEADSDYRTDWDQTVLFLRYSYFGEQAKDLSPSQIEDYASWIVHAAASCPACPRDVLRFLCRFFPQQGLTFDSRGFTPLLHVCLAQEMDEPQEWDEVEDGFREHVQHTIKSEESDSRVAAPVSRNPETAIEILLRYNRIAMAYPDSKLGRLPLVHALVSGKSWNSCKPLITSFPVLDIVDRPTGFLLFQLAALYSPDLDTVLALTRSSPDLLMTANTLTTPATSTTSTRNPKRQCSHDDECYEQQREAKNARLC